MSDFIIRQIKPEDGPRLLEIYSYYIEKTAVTFEWDVPGINEWKERIESIVKNHPYLVCETKGPDGKNILIGYAYAHTFNTRKAYDWTFETSIYLDKDFRKCGAGTLLYKELEKKCLEMGIKNLLTKICYAEVEDEYISHASIIFHEKSGYRKVGHLEKVGFKFGRWYDIIMMQKQLIK